MLRLSAEDEALMLVIIQYMIFAYHMIRYMIYILFYLTFSLLYNNVKELVTRHVLLLQLLSYNYSKYILAFISL